MSYQLVSDQRFNQEFKGHAESCLYEFTVNLPDQLGARWTAEQFVQAHVDQLQGQNSILLELRLWEDKMSGTFTTDYRVEIVASASPLWWNLIILGVLAVIAIIATAWIIREVKDIAQYSPAAAAAISWGIFVVLGVAAAAVLSGIFSRR